MSLGRLLGDSGAPLPVSKGGTGAASEQAARTNLAVPGLETTNAFSKNQTIAGSVDMEGNFAVYGDITVEAGTLTVRGDIGNANIQLNKTGSFVFFDASTGSRLLGLSANPTGLRLQTFPDASGAIVVSADTPAAGTILYHDGSVWKCLAAPGDALPHTLSITSGVLSWA